MYPTKKYCPDDGEESVYTLLQALQTATLAGIKDEGPYQSQSFSPRRGKLKNAGTQPIPIEWPYAK